MSLEEHLAALLHDVVPLEPLDITLNESIDCQVVGDVSAPRPLPHFATCAVDGFAVRSADLATAGEAAFKVIDDVRPGFAPTQPVYAQVTVRVAAGTPVPAGADAIVPAAPGTVAKVGQSVTLTGPVVAGAGVTPVGRFAAEGDVVVPDGSVVNPHTVGLLSELGELRVSVRPHPRIVVLTIGDELLPLGAPATAGLTYDSIGPMLAAAAEVAGAVSYRVGPVAADARVVDQAIDDQLIRSDLVVVVGSISSPEAMLRQRLAAVGQVSFDEGSTSLGAFGHGYVGEDRIPVLALPGDPVAAALLFAVLAVPMIHAMRGVRAPHPVQVRLGQAIPRTAVTQLIPAQLVQGVAVPAASGDLVELSRADVLVRVLPGSGEQPADAMVPALRLRRDVAG